MKRAKWQSPLPLNLMSVFTKEKLLTISNLIQSVFDFQMSTLSDPVGYSDSKYFPPDTEMIINLFPGVRILWSLTHKYQKPSWIPRRSWTSPTRWPSSRCIPTSTSPTPPCAASQSGMTWLAVSSVLSVLFVMFCSFCSFPRFSALLPEAPVVPLGVLHARHLRWGHPRQPPARWAGPCPSQE